MGKRDIERDFDELEDEILSSLEPEARFTLSMKARIEGRDDHERRLLDTAESENYAIQDLALQERLRFATKLSMAASQELERGFWRFIVAELQGLYQWELAMNYDIEEWEGLEEPSEENEFLEGRAKDVAATFLVNYNAWERFAETELDVSLNEFLSLATRDQWIEDLEFMARLSAGRDLDGDLEGWGSGRQVVYDGEEVSIETASERKADELSEMWDEMAHC